MWCLFEICLNVSDMPQSDNCYSTLSVFEGLLTGSFCAFHECFPNLLVFFPLSLWALLSVWWSRVLIKQNLCSRWVKRVKEKILKCTCGFFRDFIVEASVLFNVLHKYRAENATGQRTYPHWQRTLVNNTSLLKQFRCSHIDSDDQP